MVYRRCQIQRTHAPFVQPPKCEGELKLNRHTSRSAGATLPHEPEGERRAMTHVSVAIGRRPAVNVVGVFGHGSLRKPTDGQNEESPRLQG